MADFYGCLMSTSFRVKDRDAFLDDPEFQDWRDYAKALGGFFDDGRTFGQFAIGYEGLYPSTVRLNDTQEQETSLADLIHRHIADEEVAVIAVSGNEKLRYIGGVICFVTASGIVYWSQPCVAWDDHITPDTLRESVRLLYKEIKHIT